MFMIVSPIASRTRSSAASANNSSEASPYTASRPISSITGTAKGETRSSSLWVIRPAYARQHITEPAQIEQPRRGVGARGAQQHVIGLMLAQHVVDEVGGEQHLPPRLLRADEAARDQPGDHRAGLEGALHQRRFGEPGFEIVAQHVGIEQRVEIKPALPDHRRQIAEPPHRQRVFVGDEAERPGARALQPPRQQHAQRLMRQPALERIAHQIMLAGARKALDHQLAHAGHLRDVGLQPQPFADLIRQRAPGARIVEQFAHPFGEIGRERKFAAHIGRHASVLVMGARDIDLVLDQRLVAHHLAAEHEGVVDQQPLDEGFLDLAEQPAAAPDRAGRAAAATARAHQPHFQHGVFDDGADIQPIALPHFRIGDAPAALLVLPDAGEALVALQRVAAGGDEIERVVEIGARQLRIGRRAQHFRIELIGEERRTAGAAEHMLRQHVERAGAQRRRILRVLGDRVDRDATFQHFEAIGRHQHRARGLIEPVIGAADPLHQPRRALWRADIDDEIDVAPVDAEIERRGAHHAAQRPAAIASSTLRRCATSSEP